LFYVIPVNDITRIQAQHSTNQWNRTSTTPREERSLKPHDRTTTRTPETESPPGLRETATQQKTPAKPLIRIRQFS
jgi:hypothetical protein